jgi:uncharacterized repeat protein (TIGR01451 family)
MNMRVKTVSMLVVFLIFLSVVSTPQTKADPWWNYDWQYRLPVTINNTGGPLTDYQVKLIIDHDNDMQPNYEDLRFIDSDGNELSYWIEDDTADPATVWVKVPSIPASSTTTICMYYGNPSASSASNGVNTFEFFDDFDSYSGWSGDTTEFAITMLNSENVLYTDGASGYPGWIYKSIPSLDSYSIQIKLRDEQDNNNNPHPGVIIAGTDGNNWNSVYFRANWNQVVGSTTTIGHNVFGTPLHSYNIAGATWYDIEVIVYNGVLQHLYIDGTELTNFSGWNIYDELSIAGLEHYGATDGPGYYDKLRVRKYVSPEPTTSLGDEQGVTNLTIKKVEDTDPVNSGDALKYTITIKNNGDVPADNIVVTETYDSNFIFDFSIPSPDYGNNQWTFVSISPGEEKKITITGTVAQNGETALSNTISFTSDNAGSGSATEDTIVSQIPPIIQNLWGVNIINIGSGGTFAVENGMKVGGLTLEKGENEILVDVYNRGILKAYNVKLEVLNLPWARIEISPEIADIPKRSIQTYTVYLDIPESAPSGFYIIKIEAKGNFILEAMEIEVEIR